MSSETTAQQETQEAIMDATYRALCKHGYSDLTIQAIGDEFEKSKSLLYYHYDTKDELLVAFLDYLLSQFTVDDAIDPTDDPETQLHSFIDTMVPKSIDEEGTKFQTALLELRSQALSNEVFREQFTRADGIIRETVAEILRDGVESGVFQDIEIEETAELLVSTITGVMLQRATGDRGMTVRRVRKSLQNFVQSEVVR